jgi:4-hydroxybenzoate polyprenyltransferase
MLDKPYFYRGRERSVAEPAVQCEFTGISRLKLFWALSRTSHGLLDMCAPAFAALLWLGRFPPVEVVLIGLLTTFAGYTAVYALNDLVDYRVDREKAAAGELTAAECDIDGVVVRHPMAQGFLSFGEGLAWAAAWSATALVGAYLLNPVCLAIFVGGCALEALYCRLWRVSPYRTLVSGAVKTCGALAAVFAVDPQPSALFLTALVLTFFFWELGGQNIPNDLMDLEEDRRLKARTLPIHCGVERAVGIAAAALAAVPVFTVAVIHLGRLAQPSFAALLALAACAWLLLWPGLRLFRDRDRSAAMRLFNRASYFPAVMLAVVLMRLLT